MFRIIPPTLAEQNWRPTLKWALGQLALYVIAACVGAGIVVFVALILSMVG